MSDCSARASLHRACRKKSQLTHIRRPPTGIQRFLKRRMLAAQPFYIGCTFDRPGGAEVGRPRMALAGFEEVSRLLGSQMKAPFDHLRNITRVPSRLNFMTQRSLVLLIWRLFDSFTKASSAA